MRLLHLVFAAMFVISVGCFSEAKAQSRDVRSPASWTTMHVYPVSDNHHLTITSQTTLQIRENSPAFLGEQLTATYRVTGPMGVFGHVPIVATEDRSVVTDGLQSNSVRYSYGIFIGGHNVQCSLGNAILNRHDNHALPRFLWSAHVEGRAGRTFHEAIGALGNGSIQPNWFRLRSTIVPTTIGDCRLGVGLQYEQAHGSTVVRIARGTTTQRPGVVLSLEQPNSAAPMKAILAVMRERRLLSHTSTQHQTIVDAEVRLELFHW